MNTVNLVGRITNDVEVQKTQSGVSVTKFTLAVNRKFKKDEADFIRCVAWRNQADFLGNYIKKGALLGITGRIETGSYDDKDGKRVYTTEVVVDDVQALESKAQREQNQDYQEPIDEIAEEPQQAPTLDITNDDLPF